MNKQYRSKARRPRGRAFASQGGFTLIEVVVATMVSAMMVTAFFSIALSAKVQSFRADHRLAAARHATRVLERLKYYVADTNLTGVVGPTGLGNSGTYPDELTSTQWALTPGTHLLDATAAGLSNDPAMQGLPGLAVRYCVAAAGTTQACAGTNLANIVCPPSASGLSGNSAIGARCVAVEVFWNEQSLQ